MTHLTDAAIERLREAVDRPDAGERYDIHELIGRGGMGAVYRATDRTLQRDVALKVLPAEVDQHELVHRLEREARVLASLEHPGIVAVHDAGSLADGRPYYTMRLVRGRRLDEQVREEGRGQRLRHVANSQPDHGFCRIRRDECVHALRDVGEEIGSFELGVVFVDANHGGRKT